MIILGLSHSTPWFFSLALVVNLVRLLHNLVARAVNCCPLVTVLYSAPLTVIGAATSQSGVIDIHLIDDLNNLVIVPVDCGGLGTHLGGCCISEGWHCQ